MVLVKGMPNGLEHRGRETGLELRWGIVVEKRPSARGSDYIGSYEITAVHVRLSLLKESTGFNNYLFL